MSDKNFLDNLAKRIIEMMDSDNGCSDCNAKTVYHQCENCKNPDYVKSV